MNNLFVHILVLVYLQVHLFLFIGCIRLIFFDTKKIIII
jgi:hypothetical protein